MRRPLFWIGVITLLLIAVVYSFGILPDSFIPEIEISEITELRENICNIILCKFSPNVAGIFCAILIGEKEYLTNEVISAFRMCGMSHILVVSGMHLAITAGFVNILLEKANRYIKLVIILIFVWSYALLTGFGLSSIRAALMVSLSQIALILHRRGDTLTSLAFAGILIGIFSPSSITSASFLLSVSSIIGIAVFSKKLPVSISAQIGTLPVVTMLFGYLPFFGIIANIIAVPLLTPILILGILWVVFPFITPIISFLINIIVVIAKLFSNFHLSSIGVGELWQKMIIVTIYFFIIYVVTIRPNKTFVKNTAIILTCVTLLLNMIALVALYNTITITSFRKKGTTVFMLGTHAIIFNVPESKYDVTSLSNYLHSQNIFTIDMIFEDEKILPNQVYSFTSQNKVTQVIYPNTNYSVQDVYDIIKVNGYRIRTKIKNDF